MAKNVTVNDLRERVQLLRIQWKTDEELNRKEYLLQVAEVFACVEVKNSANESTETGVRPMHRYKVTIRKNNLEFEYIKYKDCLYKLTAPAYDIDNKYTVFEVGGIYGKTPELTEYPETSR